MADQDGPSRGRPATNSSTEVAVEIASVPEQIRGYEDVKERHLEEAREKERELLEAFALRATPTPAS